MASEIERRWLLDGEPPVDLGALRRAEIEQRYLPRDDEWTMRVRRTVVGVQEVHHLTVKRRVSDLERDEAEPPIPKALHDSVALHAGSPIVKTRWRLPWNGAVVEIDFFRNPELDGLWLAEVELRAVDQPFTPPAWFGREITHERGWTNIELAERLRR